MMLAVTFSHRTSRLLPLLRLTSGVAIVSLLLTGCFQSKPLKPELKMQVESSGSTGTFKLRGQTNIPVQNFEGRKQPIVVTVEAIRRLRPKPNAKRLSNQEPFYAVLDRQKIETMDGKWETELNLRQSAQGRALEVWQLNQGKVPLELDPEQEVIFLAVTNPLPKLINLDPEALKPKSAGDRNSLIQFAANGDVYLQAEQTQSIAPPSNPNPKGKLTQTVVRVPVKREVKKADSDQLQAPLSPQELVR
jgi:hypothetical protein